MADFLIFTLFIIVMAILQKISSNRIVAYNNNLSEGLTPKKDHGLFMIIAMVTMMCLAMFRSVNIGADTLAYHEIFTDIISTPDYSQVKRYEIGYIWINKLVGEFTTNPQGIIIVTSFFYYSVFIWFIKKYSHDYAFVTIVFSLVILSESVNIIRQQIATAFLLIAFDKILNKKNIHALIFIVIAALFHKSAIVFLIFLIMPHVRYNHMVALIILIIAIILLYGQVMYKICLKINPYYAQYFLREDRDDGMITDIYLLCRSVIFFSIINIGFIRTKQNDIRIKMFDTKISANLQRNVVMWITFAIVLFATMSFYLFVVTRFITYLCLFSIIFLSNALDRFDKYRGNIIKIGIIIILILYWVVMLIMRPTWNSTFPYEFFWQFKEVI